MIHSRLKFAQIFRTTRKLFKYNQKELANRLDITQGTISKLENGSLGPDTVLWYQFCKEFDLIADITYKTGYLFFANKMTSTGLEFKMGLFSLDRTIKVREILPFIQSLEELGLIEDFHILLRDRGFDTDMLIIPEYFVPFDLILDIFGLANAQNKDKEFISSSVNHYLIEKLNLINYLELNLKDFVLHLNSEEPFFNIQKKDKNILVNVISDFRFSIEEQDALQTYLNFKAKALSLVLKKVFNFKGIKVLKHDNFSYLIGV